MFGHHMSDLNVELAGHTGIKNLVRQCLMNDVVYQTRVFHQDIQTLRR